MQLTVHSRQSTVDNHLRHFIANYVNLNVFWLLTIDCGLLTGLQNWRMERSVYKAFGEISVVFCKAIRR